MEIVYFLLFRPSILFVLFKLEADTKNYNGRKLALLHLTHEMKCYFSLRRRCNWDVTEISCWKTLPAQRFEPTTFQLDVVSDTDCGYKYHCLIFFIQASKGLTLKSLAHSFSVSTVLLLISAVTLNI